MANYLLETLNDHLTGEAKRVTKINKDYLEDQLAKNSDLFIRQKIYNLIADQVEMMTMAEVKENFAFKVLDPPMVPDQKSKPKRTLMVILSLFVSLFVGVFLAFFKEYLEKNNIQLEVSWPKWLWRQSK
jgi:capsular polysaccharide biosynthesis protein